MKKFVYNNKEYSSLNLLRKELKNIIFPAYPTEEHLNMMGITVIEVPDSTVEEEPLDPITEAKQIRDSRVNSITVEIDGMVFDGNETAQKRISNAILGWDDNVEEIEWILYNNQIAKVTKEQLQRALQLAIANMQEIWITPYKIFQEE